MAINVFIDLKYTVEYEDQVDEIVNEVHDALQLLNLGHGIRSHFIEEADTDE